MKRAGTANVRNYMIYDFKGKPPRSLYCLRERLESRSLARWVQYSVVEAERLDIALEVAHFCCDRGAKVNLIRGTKCGIE